MNRKNNSSSLNFIFYTLIVISLSAFLLLKISIKNECINTIEDIEALNNTYINNSSIIKELQSTRDYLLSHDYISNYVSDKMIVAVPETLIININNIR